MPEQLGKLVEMASAALYSVSSDVDGARYKVSGNTLELDLASGQVRRLLAFHPFSDQMRDSTHICGTTYNLIPSK
jgi:hypothetical protein